MLPLRRAYTRRSRMAAGSGRVSRGFVVFVAVISLVACAPERLGSDSAIVRQGAQPASAGGGNFEAASGQQTAGQGGSSQQIQDKTLVIGIAAEVRGFSPLNGLQ